MCRAEGGENPDVYVDHIRHARKEHKCSECGRPIMPGEIYRSHFYVYDGNADTSKTCSHCCVGQDWLAHNCGGYIFEQVIEEIHEHAEEYPHPSTAIPLLRIAAGARRRWKRFDGAGLLPIPRMPPDISVSEHA